MNASAARADDPIHEHLLTHRLRGFSPYEASLPALRAALACGVRYVEFDTRVTADGEILALHDARLDRLTGSSGRVADHSIQAEGRPHYKGDDSVLVPTLRELVEEFARGPGDSELLIDLKDRGFEAEHHGIVQDAGVSDRVWYVSWYPEVLLRLHDIAPEARLSFSHVPLTRWATAARLASALSLRGAVIRAASRCLPSGWTLRELEGVSVHVDDCDRTADAGTRECGAFPIHMLTGLPEGRLGEALRASGGSLGILARFLTAEYVARAHAGGFKVFVFSLDDRASIERAVLEYGVDVVFTNEASLWRCS